MMIGDGVASGMAFSAQPADCGFYGIVPGCGGKARAVNVYAQARAEAVLRACAPLGARVERGLDFSFRPGNGDERAGRLLRPRVTRPPPPRVLGEVGVAKVSGLVERHLTVSEGALTRLVT